MKKICDACNSGKIYSIYALERTPVFLNRLYDDRGEALASPAAKVDLVCCPDCGLIFNADFQDKLLVYDERYIQSQGHSRAFQAYTSSVIDLYLEDLRQGSKVVEIGCGKEAYFLKLLLERGVDAYGFDPVYEGADPRVFKKYFNSDNARELPADVDVVIMRLCFYLFERPLDFLAGLKKFLPEHASVIIEVPRFEWILEKRAFWDISHEVCNYLTEDFMQNIFSGKAKIHRTFSDQYMIVKASLRDLRLAFGGSGETRKYENVFSKSLPAYADTLKRFKTNYIWGAGAKGNAFANILDKEARLISAVVDINAEKQGQFVPLTGHPCIAPEAVAWGDLGDDACLWIMNENYKSEILGSIPGYRQKVVVLGEEVPA